MGAGKGNVKVVTTAPNKSEILNQIEEKDLKYYAKIYPDEPGKVTLLI
jgi:hypothetical protein